MARAETELFAAPGTKTAFGSTFHLVGDTASAAWRLTARRSLVAGRRTARGCLGVRTNVKTVMQAANNASLYTRIKFDAPNLASLQALTLKMQYDDGYVRI